MPSDAQLLAAEHDIRAQRLVITAAMEAELQPLPIAAPAEGQALVRHTHTLISAGTELAIYRGTHPALADPASSYFKYPFRPGYAAVGVVVGTAGVCPLRPGDRVLYDAGHAGGGALDPDQRLWARLPPEGALAPYALARMAQIAATAETVCPRGAERVLVIGTGLVGLMAAQVFRAVRQVEVTVADLLPSRLEVARRCGLSTAVVTREAPLVLAGEAPDVVVEATGVAAQVPEALRLVRPGGCVILLGSPREPVTIDLQPVHAQAKSLIGAHEMIPAMDHHQGPSRRQLLQRMVDLIHRGDLKVEPLITDCISPDQAPQAYRGLVDHPERHLGVVVDWSRADGA